MCGCITDDPRLPLPPAVQFWQYDEIVFNDPHENFFNTLTNHPPTPLPPPQLGAGKLFRCLFIDRAELNFTGNARPIPWHPSWPKAVVGEGNNVAGEGVGTLRSVPGFHSQLSKMEGDTLKAAVAELKTMLDEARGTLEEKERELTSLKARTS
jgi:hypothetical protein